MKRGVLSASTTGGPLDTITSPSRQQSWTLDALGNWSGLASDGSTTTRQFNAANQATSVSGSTGNRNRCQFYYSPPPMKNKWKSELTPISSPTNEKQVEIRTDTDFFS